MIVATAMVALPTAASAAPAWSEATTLGQSGHESGAPEVAIAPDGEAIVAWEGSRPDGVEVSSRRPGEGWTQPVELTKYGEVDGPHVAVSARKAVVLWSGGTQSRTDGASVVMAATRIRGEPWSRGKDISAETRWRRQPEGEAPQVTLTRSGRAIAIWSASDEGHSTTPFIRSATQSALGTEWSAPVDLPGSIEGESPQVAATPAGEAVALWSATYNEESGLETSSRASDGKWKWARRLDNPGGFAEPQLATTARGEAVGVWIKEFEADGSQVLQVAARRPSGRWKVRSLAPETKPYDPSIVTGPGGGVRVVWVLDDPVAEGETVVSSTRPPGGSWTAPKSLVAEGLQLPSGAYPEMAVTDAGETVAVWTTDGPAGKGPTIQEAREPRGRPWSEPTNIATSPARRRSGLSDLQIAVAPSGEALAIWRSFNGTQWVIEAVSRGPASK